MIKAKYLKCNLKCKCVTVHCRYLNWYLQSRLNLYVISHFILVFSDTSICISEILLYPKWYL